MRLSCLAMASRFELVLHGSDPVHLRAAGEEALAEIVRLDQALSIYRPDSSFSRINARAAAEPAWANWTYDPAVFAPMTEQELREEGWE